MHRMGVAPEDLDGVVDVLTQSEAIDLEGLYTHFSVADGSSAEDRAFTREQIALFDEVVADLAARGAEPRIVHAANSAGALGYPEARRTMVRVGLSLYGYLPEAWLASALEASGERLIPAMTLRAHVVAVRRVEAGERPSYKRRRALDERRHDRHRPLRLRRRLSPSALRRGRRGPDQRRSATPSPAWSPWTCWWSTAATTPWQPGDEVVLLGRQGDEEITADEWAERAGTISWEILCGIGARVPRILVD